MKSRVPSRLARQNILSQLKSRAAVALWAGLLVVAGIPTAIAQSFCEQVNTAVYYIDTDFDSIAGEYFDFDEYSDYYETTFYIRGASDCWLEDDYFVYTYTCEWDLGNDAATSNVGNLAEDVWLCLDSRWSIKEDQYDFVSFVRGDGARIIVDLHDGRYLMFHVETAEY